MAKDEIKIIEYKDIGKVSFIKKSSARSLRITIKLFKEVLVTVPASVSLEHAGRFVEQKASWIRKSQLRIHRYEQRMTVFEEDTAFKTRFHQLALLRHQASTIKTVIGQGRISILFPDFAPVDNERIQQVIRNGINTALRIEAKKYLPQRVEELSDQFSLSFSRVIVRDNKSRWGSCSRDNHISLNIHLMRLPDHLCDYVILHELAHTVHKHHQKPFWDFMDKLTLGKARVLDKELNNYSPHFW